MLRLDKLLRQDPSGLNGRLESSRKDSQDSHNTSTTDSNSITSEDSALAKKGVDDTILSSSGAESEEESSPRLQRVSQTNDGEVLRSE